LKHFFTQVQKKAAQKSGFAIKILPIQT
jgi:hypothetical protein